MPARRNRANEEPCALKSDLTSFAQPVIAISRAVAARLFRWARSERQKMKAEIEPAGGPARMPPGTGVNRLVTASAEEGAPKPYGLLDISIPEGVIFLSLLFLVHLTTYYYNYLLFHTLAEIFSIFIAITIAFITINCLSSIENQYLRFIGISYLFVGLLDLMHTLSFKGMPIFTDYDYYAPQFWIAARYVESLSMLAGFGLLRTKSRINPVLIAVIYLVLSRRGSSPQFCTTRHSRSASSPGRD